ncbi:HepT-like ribonuclease domain-containing protein [Fundidesulfovibrio magnetotacticus]|uniref:HepT-like ribonuclease domain-containing protein n=1 Tax=Fundidesulfovibrio magnetotacticus TaxID=2730080 RepID=UPI0035307713
MSRGHRRGCGQDAARFSRKHPRIPWAAIAGMRNRMVHDYFEVDIELCWRTITRSLPELQEYLQAIVDNDRPGY